MMHGVWRGRQQSRPTRVTRGMVLRAGSYFRPYWREGLVVLATLGIMRP